MSRIHTHTHSGTKQYVTNSYTYVQSESLDVPDGEIDNVKGHLAAHLLLFFNARCFDHALALHPHHSRDAPGGKAQVRTHKTHAQNTRTHIRALTSPESAFDICAGTQNVLSKSSHD
jgi:hypothetical protein